MIVCSCAVITDHEIRDAVAWMRASDPTTLITPGKIYRALGRRPDCGGCVSLFVQVMKEDANTEVPLELRGLRARAAGRKDNG